MIHALVRLYPRRWRDRYGAEFHQFITDVSGDRPAWRLAADVVRGALDAHLSGRYGMRRFLADASVRVGAFDGLIVSALIAIDVVLTNVVFPPGPRESDSDPEYVAQNLAIYAVLALLLVAIGARAGRRAARAGGKRAPIAAGALAGAVAGGVIALATTLVFLAVNNLFLSIVSRQHDKRLAFAASGWHSMRAYLTVQQLLGGAFLVVGLGLVGAVLGLAGAAVLRTAETPRLMNR